MIKSMTGFGAAAGELRGFRARFEIKTLNNRYREFLIRAPHFLNFLEEPLKKLVQASVARGRVETWIVVDQLSSQASANVVVNRASARRIYEALQAVREENQIAAEITMSDLLVLEKYFLGSEGSLLESADPDLLWSDLKGLAETAIAQLVGMRASEGASLKADLEERLAKLEGHLKEVKALAVNVPAAVTKRFQARIEELAESLLDPNRVAQEAAILAEKLDVTEEITRFGTHLKSFRALLESAEPVGRRLEFLLQELLREANTMGSKSQSLPITDLVLTFKSELEKIREQVLNIE
ncbi:MAG: YicC family protein [Deltaproteobacteria bacterium]|jgi:uncharacterized protein (TIGR00255 family)|nr:YicC family protein [Deltaproteobacteria bacterium]